MANDPAIVSERKRHDPRRQATRVALIEAAESLFGEEGIDRVSTRQIAAAIGALNTNVVAYHFGSKERLVEAVFHHRLPALDRRRAELLAQAEAAGTGGDAAALLRVFAQPLFEQRDAAGRHSYARFLLAIERAGRLDARAQLIKDYPVTAEVTTRLVALLPTATIAQGHVRMRLVASLLAAALQIVDLAGLSAGEADALFEDGLAMAAGALLAPKPEGESV